MASGESLPPVVVEDLPGVSHPWRACWYLGCLQTIRAGRPLAVSSIRTPSSSQIAQAYPIAFWSASGALTALALAGLILDLAERWREGGEPGKLRQHYLAAIADQYKVFPLVINREEARNMPDIVYQQLTYNSDLTKPFNEAEATERATLEPRRQHQGGARKDALRHHPGPTRRWQDRPAAPLHERPRARRPLRS